MKSVRISINSIRAINDFNIAVNKVKGSVILINEGKKFIDAQSAMGLYTLNLLKTFLCEIKADTEEEEEAVLTAIKPWVVE